MVSELDSTTQSLATLSPYWADIIPFICSNQFNDLEYAMLGRGNHHSAKFWLQVLLPVIPRSLIQPCTESRRKKILLCDSPYGERRLGSGYQAPAETPRGPLTFYVK